MPRIPDATRAGGVPERVSQPEILFSKPFVYGAGVAAGAMPAVIVASSVVKSTALAAVRKRRPRCRLRMMVDMSTATF
jgi:hypothetical protein